MHSVMMAPSILSADFLNLQDSVALIAEGADYIHVDVMDGHFVPNLTIGPTFVKKLKGAFNTPLDVHLMVSNPDEQVDWYLDAGADLVTFHQEAAVHAHRLIQHIHDRGAKAGIAINPATPVALLRDIVEYCDLVLIMSVNPGFGGQAFIESAPRRIAELRALCDELNSSAIIEVDGGVSTTTAPLVTAAGARLLVAGSAVFKAQDPNQAMEAIRAAGQQSLVEA